ncbi:MAG: NAD(P)/FAD-dependent oxidoreductase, partial [Acidimicrobiia bacterium]
MIDSGFDVIVLGAGPAGENAAEVAARHGLEVAIVERELVGGECSYWACMPSKALLRPGDVAYMADHTPGFTGGNIDVETALTRRNALAGNWNDAGQVAWLEDANVRLIRGHCRLAGERIVSVEHPDGRVSRHQASRAVIVATGSSSAMPPIEGLAETDVWDSRDVTTAKEIPPRLLVIGGGVVGVEMAQAWKTLGSAEVTLIELFDSLLVREEPAAGAQVRQSFEEMGIRVMTGARTQRISRSRPDGPVAADVLLADGSNVWVEADEVLIATGRRPNTTDLGLEAVGLEPGDFISVDDHLEAVDVPGGWLYAVGDVNGRSLLTHTGKYQARIAGSHIAGVPTSAWGDLMATPRVVFTNPKVAAVGLTEAGAREAGIPIRTVEYD